MSDRGTKEQILCTPARYITPIFVACDVTTILIQVSGTSIAAGSEWVGTTADIGSYILLAGLAIQTVTIALFLIIILRFSGRYIVSIKSPSRAQGLDGLRSAFISSVFIEVRSPNPLL